VTAGERRGRLERAGRTSQARGTTWQRFCADASRLPGIEPGTSYATPALYVRKKLLARLREDGETVAIGVDFLDRDVLLEADPEAFYLTDHYRAYPWVLMRLSRVRHAAALELLEQAWRRAAPRRLIAAHTPSPAESAPRTGAPRRRERRLRPR
jgi:hypothetical protein